MLVQMLGNMLPDLRSQIVLIKKQFLFFVFILFIEEKKQWTAVGC